MHMRCIPRCFAAPPTAVLALVLWIAAAPSATAQTVFHMTAASPATDLPGAPGTNVTFTLHVTGSQLLVDYLNQNTGAAAPYDLHEFWFNTGPALLGLSLGSGPPGESVSAGAGNGAGSFGKFTWDLAFGGTHLGPQAMPYHFVFNMTGTTTDAEIATLLSTGGYHDAVHLIGGPNGYDSVKLAGSVTTVTATPEGSSVAMLPIGMLPLLGIALRRRMRSRQQLN